MVQCLHNVCYLKLKKRRYLDKCRQSAPADSTAGESCDDLDASEAAQLRLVWRIKEGCWRAGQGLNDMDYLVSFVGRELTSAESDCSG